MTSPPLTRESRARGTLLGLAWGDAFGCPIEGWREARIAEVFGRYDALPVEYPLGAMTREERERLRPLGIHSDDTQQAMALVHLGLGEGATAARWADVLVRGKRCAAWRGTGRHFDDAVRKLARGVAPEASGSASAGIGAAMRIAPLGAIFAEDDAALARVVLETSHVTHGDLRAGAIAYAVACAAALLVRGRSVVEVRAELARRVRAVEDEWTSPAREGWTLDRSGAHQVSDGLASIWDGATPLGDPRAIRDRVSTIARPHLREGFTRAHPSQGFCLLGGLHGVAMALSDLDDPRAILSEIVRQGFDTDTVAAVAGGILGARFGHAWIPADRLLDRARLEALADAIAEARAPGESLDALLASEAGWTRHEREFQASLR